MSGETPKNSGFVPTTIEGRSGILVSGSGHVVVDGGPLQQQIDDLVGPSAAALVPDWFIDEVNGNDDNVGTTPATALKTHEELRRRVRRTPIDQSTRVHILSDLSDSNAVLVDFILGPAGLLTYVGEKPTTILYTSPGGFTAVTPTDPLTNQQLQITDAALPADWGPSGLLNTPTSFTRVRITAGPRAGRVGYPVRDVNGPRTARSSDFTLPFTSLPNSFVPPETPVVGDPFVVETGLTRIANLVVDATGHAQTSFAFNDAQLLFTNIELDHDDNKRHPISMVANARFQVPPSAQVLFSGCNTALACPVQGSICTMHASKVGESSSGFASVESGLGHLSIQTCLVASGLQLGGRYRTDVGLFTLFELGASLQVDGGAWCRVTRVGIFNAPFAAVLVLPGGLVRAAPESDPASHLYGADNPFGVRVASAGTFIFEVVKPTITAFVDETNVGGGAGLPWAGFGDNFTNLANLATISKLAL